MVRARFQLPSTAAQGPATWYLVRLHVAAVVSVRAGGGATVSAATNGRTAAMVEFTPTGQGVDWQTVSIAEQGRHGHAADGHADVLMSNYLQVKGVTGGLNTLTVDADVWGGARVERLRVLPDTCVEQTGTSPETLQAKAGLEPETPESGADFNVNVLVRNAGTRDVRNLRVIMTPSDDGLVPLRGHELTAAEIRGEWKGSLPFLAATPGRHSVRLDVVTPLSGRVGGTVIPIVVARPGRVGPAWPLLALGVCVLALAGLIARRLYGRHPRGGFRSDFG
ncbi:hypothetical protein ACIBHX_25495 [Nonomuraea sp. NPDC050536]|uniref:hypothetical protein n=1 Tax=Nonomuraea sp. NPDC050536 TaxID=3364366 RepID=UPI0037C5B769